MTINDLIISVGMVISILGSVSVMKKAKEKTVDGQVSQESLTTNEKLKVWALALLNPIWTDIILYYGLRKKLPVKAKRINIICFIAFGLWILFSFLIGFPVNL